MRRVFESDFYTIQFDDAFGFAQVVRTAKPFPTVESAVRGNGELVKAMQSTRGLKRLLLDLRNGPPGRNDPEFEQATEGARRAMGDVERVAVLVRTAAGKLQARRLAGPTERMQVFQDEDEALRFLRA